MSRRKKTTVPTNATTCANPYVCPDCREKMGLPPAEDGDLPEPPTESMALGYIDSLMDLTKRVQEYRIENAKTEDKEFASYMYELEYKLVVMICTAAERIGPDTSDAGEDETEDEEAPAN